ncbi:UNVERIFIED_CONTAM: hypothetical protein PYX00_009327 [Menopon gallinae]|uniref:Uncharacterized protein n=1 Tax=Menopon gallinae TaxID=328185 RepID=A0AAW2HB24_9NEOP
MQNRQLLAWAFVTLFASTSLSPALCLPSTGRPEFRKFAEKPNALKKVAIDHNDIDDVSTNQLQYNLFQSARQESGFSWSNMLAMIMQMIFNPTHHIGPNKSDSIDTEATSSSPWANIISVGLKILTALLGGGGMMGGSDGIDKVDNSSPMQGILAAVLSAVLGSKDPDQVASMAKQAGEFINIVVNLLDALKTSFSHRSMQARSLGKKDSVSDAATAGLSMLKAYVRSLNTSDEKCMQKYVCEANKECSDDLSGTSSLYCKLATYTVSFLMERTSSASSDSYYSAGRRGRLGEDCRALYVECNEI